jgi:hypothetical protein
MSFNSSGAATAWLVMIGCSVPSSLFSLYPNIVGVGNYFLPIAACFCIIAAEHTEDNADENGCLFAGDSLEQRSLTLSYIGWR